MNSLDFSYPYVLLFLIIIPFLVFFVLRKDKKRYAHIKYSDVNQIQSLPKTWKIRLRLLPDWLRITAIALLIVAIARPQFSFSKHNKDILGIDIIIAMDVSPSMLAEDFSPNRLESAKAVAKDFILNRDKDEIGLVVFSGEAFTQCPPTIDHNVLIQLLSKTECGDLQDGTAIGDGLAVSINRIKESKAKSKVIILITDGVNNSGQIDPINAASLAKQFGIRVYTVGIGSKGKAPFSYRTPFGIQKGQIDAEIDEGLLKTIASQTGGQYFRSTKKSSLEEIFKEIDSLEKSIINVSSYQQNNDTGDKLCLWVLFLIILECILRYGVFKTKY
ncbi:MAG: VWA domain-containing protein [Bacteroidales bacterium]|nr:VWA domain-containing protein [Bacteroidales bacterium]